MLTSCYSLRSVVWIIPQKRTSPHVVLGIFIYFYLLIIHNSYFIGFIILLFILLLFIFIAFIGCLFIDFLTFSYRLTIQTPNSEEEQDMNTKFMISPARPPHSPSKVHIILYYIILYYIILYYIILYYIILYYMLLYSIIT